MIDIIALSMNEGGDIERLTDEEANELIRECKPIYPKVRNPLTDKGDFIRPSFLFISQIRFSILLL